ncbi:MAG: type IX secretion system membrane protein PorP/SprF [Bacteroidetes bacterium]|nr:MAG: type IX secretion system membrane protein PorP/SprF [Bacteroidota bacterium]
MKRLIFISLFLIIGKVLHAQDPQFTQFYASPITLNPGFAGNTEQHRISGNYRNQWAAVPTVYRTFSFAYDYSMPEINSGVALMVLSDKAGSGGLYYTNINFSYSYHIQLNRKYFIRPGIRFGYVMRGIDVSQLIFPDQNVRGTQFSPSQNLIVQNTQYIDIASGMVFSDSKKFWAGISINHLNQPVDGLRLNSESKMPAEFSFHGGYNYILKTEKGKVKTKLTAATQYKAQKQWDQWDIGFYFNHEPVIVGFWYRGIPLLKAYEKGYPNNDAFAVLVAYSANNFRIGYSYDITISKLTNNFRSGSGGSHEIAIIYEWADPNRKKVRNRKKFLVPCAKF